MFERYAPIQRKIKPSMWKRIIQQALDLPESEWPVIESGNPQNQEAQSISAPRATRVLGENVIPERLATLDKARKMVAQIAEDTRTPADVIIKPQYLRNLCWTDEPQKRDVAPISHRAGREGVAGRAGCRVRESRYHVEVA